MHKQTTDTPTRDEFLEAAKRDRQARSRELVRSGERTQESMYLIAPAIVRTFKVRHNTGGF
ncbi:hypothetical protein [Paraburkholderia sediminicola]|uniref:hypothetical protein n=1 Tax=Paraburkholderia sediminicola TaxID=458836 RepID=UPI0038B9B8DA